MPADARAGFVIGAYEAIAGIARQDDAAAQADGRGFSACRDGLGVSARMMMKLVDVYFDRHPDRRSSVAVVAALHLALVDVCATYLNEARQRMSVEHSR